MLIAQILEIGFRDLSYRFILQNILANFKEYYRQKGQKIGAKTRIIVYKGINSRQTRFMTIQDDVIDKEHVILNIFELKGKEEIISVEFTIG